MKKLITSFFAVIFLISCSSPAEKLLLGGSGWDKIVVVDKATKQIEWEYLLERGWECNSVDVDQAGNILFSYGKGARLITPGKETIWDISAPEGCELQTAKVLPDGNYLLAWCGYPATILEVNAKGETITKTEFDTRILKPHSQFRQVNKNEQGNYLVPLFHSSDLWELSPEGALINQIQLEGAPFSTARQQNGNYLVACGDAHCYVELNMKTGELVKKVSANDIAGVSLRFVAQILPTKSGGLYLCNWQGHGEDPAMQKNPQLIELNSKDEIIWSLNDNEIFGMISAVCPFR
jgi:hypothetical protein